MSDERIHSSKDIHGFSPEDLRIMRQAKEATCPQEDRLTEIRMWARQAGIKKIGIAYCASLTKVARQVGEILSDEFEIMLSNCKLDKIPLSELLEDDSQGIACNPVGQAKELEEWGSELNIMVGLCLGHDMLFHKYSTVPTAELIIKDRKYHHNPMEALRKPEDNQ